MTVSKDAIVCPYCGHMHNKYKAIGTSGLINHCGSTFGMTCDNCGNDFDGEYEVKIRYTTKKISFK